MTDSVKGIFVTLIKIPVIVVIIYLVFNVFAFSYNYFRLLGFSYIVMQTAVENNYLPPDEKNTLETYLATLEQSNVQDDGTKREIFTNLYLEVDTVDAQADGSGSVENDRVQYGTPIRITVSGHYHFILPLMPTEQVSGGDAVEGLNGTAGTYIDRDSGQIIDAMDRTSGQQNNITITYYVPGLKYYPDLQ